MSLKSNRVISSAVVVTAPLFCSGLLYGQNSIDYQVTAQWQGGYNADIVLKVDPDGSALDGWELSWMGTPEVLHYWNCEASERSPPSIPSISSTRVCNKNNLQM